MATRKLFLSNVVNMMPFVSSSVSTRLKESRLAPGGISVSEVGVVIFRGSSESETSQTIGKSTIASTASRTTWARISSITGQRDFFAVASTLTVGVVRAMVCSALCIAPTLHTLRHLVLAECQDQQDEEDEHAKGRRHAIELGRIDQLERLGDQNLGFTERSSGGNEVDDIELVEGEDRAVHDRRHHRRP